MTLRAAKSASSPFERRLKAKHGLPDHWVRTNSELRGGSR